MPSIGVLYIVATPIGNLADISQRALDTLQQVSLIAAEDTRHSKYLLVHYGIKTPMTSFHEFSAVDKLESLIETLEQGNSVALISDAGTPLISDPGYQLVNKAHEKQIKVVPIPGACAAIAALSVAGMPTDRFVFEGFLPVKAKARMDYLQQLAYEQRTLIFYEAPHRILATMQALQTCFGDTRIATLARELTKRFETIERGTLAELTDWLSQHPTQQKGEFVILVAGAMKDSVPSNQRDDDVLLKILLAEVSVKQAAKIAAKLSQTPKNTLYKRALTLQSQ